LKHVILFVNFFLALNYFNKLIFCSNGPKKPEKNQKKHFFLKKARQDQIKPDITPKQNKNKKNANRKIKMPDDFQKRKISQIWLRKTPSGNAVSRL
jgi:hypothetical protein